MSAPWRKVGNPANHDDGFEAKIQSGDIILIANVHQGGDGLWTARVHKLRLGRPHKNGRKNPRGQTIELVSIPDRPRLFTIAREWADSEWQRMFSDIETWRPK